MSLKKILSAAAKIIESRRYNNVFFAFLGRIKDSVFTIFLGHEVVLIDVGNNAAFIKNFKVASTSLHAAFDYGQEIKINKNQLRKLKYKNIFTFVRNPYSRIASAYGWCIKENAILNDLNRFGNKFYPEMDFEKFIEAVYSIPDANCDGHFMPQSFLLMRPFSSNKLIPNHIGRFENLQGDFNKICHATGISQKIIPKINHNENKLPLLKYFSQKTIYLVNKKYRNDFKLFGYKMADPYNFKNEISNLS